MPQGNDDFWIVLLNKVNSTIDMLKLDKGARMICDGQLLVCAFNRPKSTHLWTRVCGRQMMGSLKQWNCLEGFREAKYLL